MPSIQVRIPTFVRGSSKYPSPNPGETPVAHLRVQVLSCNGLASKDKNGYSDPFVTVSLLGKQFQTPVYKRNLNPVYDKGATFEFPIYMSLGPELDTLDFVVWDKDMVGKDYLGEYSLPVNKWFTGTDFYSNNALFSSFPLHSSHPTKAVSGTIDFRVGFVHPPGSTGQPDLEKTYKELISNNNNLKAGTVVVEICCIKNLPEWPNVTGSGFDMDPVVKVSIGGGDLQSTSVKKHTLNPVWNEQLFFRVRQADLSHPILLTVFDRDKFSPNDYVGEAEINIPAENTTTGDVEHPLKPGTGKKPKHEYDRAPIIKFRANYQPEPTPGQAARVDG